MAAPNIANVVSIIGKTAVQTVTTSTTAIVTNSAASNKVFKVNSLIIANIEGTSAANVTVDVFRSSVSYKIASTVVVPPDATLVLLSKDTSIYLEEGDTLRCASGANNTVQALCSYEEIS
jgi:hypothetical protein